MVFQMHHSASLDGSKAIPISNLINGSVQIL